MLGRVNSPLLLIIQQWYEFMSINFLYQNSFEALFYRKGVIGNGLRCWSIVWSWNKFMKGKTLSFMDTSCPLCIQVTIEPQSPPPRIPRTASPLFPLAAPSPPLFPPTWSFLNFQLAVISWLSFKSTLKASQTSSLSSPRFFSIRLMKTVAKYGAQELCKRVGDRQPQQWTSFGFRGESTGREA